MVKTLQKIQMTKNNNIKKSLLDNFQNKEKKQNKIKDYIQKMAIALYTWHNCTRKEGGANVW